MADSSTSTDAPRGLVWSSPILKMTTDRLSPRHNGSTRGFGPAIKELPNLLHNLTVRAFQKRCTSQLCIESVEEGLWLNMPASFIVFRLEVTTGVQLSAIEALITFGASDEKFTPRLNVPWLWPTFNSDPEMIAHNTRQTGVEAGIGSASTPVELNLSARHNHSSEWDQIAKSTIRGMRRFAFDRVAREVLVSATQNPASKEGVPRVITFGLVLCHHNATWVPEVEIVARRSGLLQLFPSRVRLALADRPRYDPTKTHTSHNPTPPEVQTQFHDRDGQRAMRVKVASLMR